MIRLTEAKVLYEKEQLEQREALRIILWENPNTLGEGNLAREEHFFRFKQVLDQRFDGIPKEAVEQDQALTSAVTNETRIGAGTTPRSRKNIHA